MSVIRIPLKLLPHQFNLIKDETTKILGLVSGFGAGKSFVAARKACKLAISNPGCDGIVTEPNFPLLTQIIVFGIMKLWKLLKTISQTMNQ